MSVNLVELAIKCFQCNVFIFENKRQTMTKYCKIKLFKGAILHCASNEPEAYLETSQASMRKRFLRKYLTATSHFRKKAQS